LAVSSSVLLQKLIVAQLIKKFPGIYGTWMFITVLVRVHHWTLAEPDDNIKMDLGRERALDSTGSRKSSVGVILNTALRTIGFHETKVIFYYLSNYKVLKNYSAPW